jgi:hypothetical protein
LLDQQATTQTANSTLLGQNPKLPITSLTPDMIHAPAAGASVRKNKIQDRIEQARDSWI